MGNLRGSLVGVELVFARGAITAICFGRIETAICAVHEIGETGDGRRFIAMENIPGETLEDRLAGESFEVDQTLELIRKTAQGLPLR